jgi:hypothetical protein
MHVAAETMHLAAETLELLVDLLQDRDRFVVHVPTIQDPSS